MKITIQNGAMTDAGLIVSCPVDTDATVDAETARQLIEQGVAVEAAKPEPKHEPKAKPEPKNDDK